MTDWTHFYLSARHHGADYHIALRYALDRATQHLLRSFHV